MAGILENRDDVERFLDVAVANLAALEGNLTSLGYEFANPDGAVVLADEAARNSLRELERRFRALPLLFRRWYETFRHVDFTQDRDQVLGQLGGPTAGLGLNCPLVFLDLKACMGLARKPMREDDGESLAERWFLPTGANASSCDPKGVWLPDEAVDPVLFDDGGGPVTMGAEIREAIACGGFPLWEQLSRRRRFASPLPVTPDYAALRPELLRGLRPL